MTICLFTVCLSLGIKKSSLFQEKNTRAQENNAQKVPFIIVVDNDTIQITPEIAQFSSVLKQQLAVKNTINLNTLLDGTSLTHVEASILFSTLETIHTKLTPRADGGYVAQQVQPLADCAFNDVKNRSLGNICNACHLLDIPLLVNACASTIISRASHKDATGLNRDTVRSGIGDFNYELKFYERIAFDITDTDIAHILNNHGFEKFTHERIVTLLRKHYFLKTGYSYCMNESNTPELSIADYIHLNGQPVVEDGVLSFRDKKITSLYGIDQIHNKDDVVTITFRENFLGYSAFDEQNISFTSFPHLTKLDLRDNDLNIIPDDIFKGLHTLNILDLGKNEFTTLKPDTFQDLVHLKELNIEEAPYITLPTELFENLNNLEVLVFDPIPNIDPSIFSALTRLKKLTMRHSLYSLPGKLFEKLTALEELDLSDHVLENVDSDSFYGLANLKKLDLSAAEQPGDWDSFTELPPHIFHPLISLQELNLELNRLRFLDPVLFQGLSNLKQLNLSFNHLQVLPTDIFKDLNNMERLYLKYAGIQQLDPLLFAHLSNLKELDLRSEYIQVLPADIFKDLNNIESLYLSGNFIQQLDPLMFTHMNNLKRVGLTGTDISSLPVSNLQAMLTNVDFNIY